MANDFDVYEKLSEKNNNDSPVIARKDSVEELSVVRKIVADIVDYVVRKEEFLSLDIPYDSDYIPSTTEENKARPCTRLCCLKGCVCASISQKTVTKHCKKEDCIFRCICSRRLLYSLRNLPHRRTSKTMLSSSPGDFQNTKRQKRVHIDAPPSPELTFIDLSNDDTPEIPTIEILDDEPEEQDEPEDNAEDNIDDENNPPSNFSLPTEDEGKLAKVVVERNLQAFREMFVWCPTHCQFICSCKGRVFDLQNNLLLNPKTDTASLKKSRHHFFDLENHCARTIGSVFEYRQRNSNRIFALKRDFEIRKGVLSNSNSCFRIDSLQFQHKLVSQQNLRTAPEKDRCQTETRNGIKSHSAPLPAEPTKVASPSSLEPKIQLIFHDNSDSSDEEPEDPSSLPKFGLLCLNGYGYLPVKEYSSTKLVFQHPVIKSIFVSKKDPEEANQWLNDLLKSFMSPQLQNTLLQWVVVQRGVLKISKPFNLKNLKADTQPAN